SHEYVEAVTDPFPPFGWGDPGSGSDFAKEGEAADICRETRPPPDPFAPECIVGETVLSTYWSNAAGGCVPSYHPSLAVFSPEEGETFAWSPGGAQVTLRAFAISPVGCEVTDVAWTVDGVELPTHGATMVTPGLDPGGHTISASVHFPYFRKDG